MLNILGYVLIIFGVMLLIFYLFIMGLLAWEDVFGSVRTKPRGPSRAQRRRAYRNASVAASTAPPAIAYDRADVDLECYLKQIDSCVSEEELDSLDSTLRYRPFIQEKPRYTDYITPVSWEIDYDDLGRAEEVMASTRYSLYKSIEQRKMMRAAPQPKPIPGKTVKE